MNTQRQRERNRRFAAEIQKIKAAIQTQQGLIGGDPIESFTDRVERITKYMAGEKERGDSLTIGIIGTVKAGKSSLLNALVFNGEEILPKAPVPMTAALTKISYAAVPQATVVFYEPYDWEKIEGQARRFNEAVEEEMAQARQMAQMDPQITYSGDFLSRSWAVNRVKAHKKVSEAVEASYELVSMMENCDYNFRELLGTKRIIPGDPGDAPEEYVEKLGDYVGADGKYTPLVNHIELQINNPLVQGFVIVDTPGLNDPIVSRSLQTKKYLMDCDVVFVVSSVGQFLTSQDMQLIEKDLESESISHAYIIGSQLDSGILQYNRAEKRFQTAFDRSMENYERQADKALSSMEGGGLFDRLKKSLPPLLTSAMMFGIARKMERGQPFDEYEEHTLKQYRVRFKDFDEVLETAEDFYVFSGIGEVKERAYDEVRRDKAAIIEEGLKKYTSDQSGELIRLLEEINITAKSNLNALRTGDVEKLEKKQEDLKEKLDSIRLEVKNIFENQAASCNRQIQNIKIEISKEVGEHTDLEIKTERERKTDPEKYGFLGLFRRNREFYEDKKKAELAQTLKNIRGYTTRAQELINKNLKEIFDEEGLRDKLKRCVIGAFDLTSKEFREDEILLPVNTLLAQLTVKKVDFKIMHEVQDRLYGSFADSNGVVEGNDIHKLHKVQEEILNEILMRLSKALDESCSWIETRMIQASGSFVDDVQKKISDNIERTRMQLSDKKKNLMLYENFIEDIARYKETVRQLGE